MLKKSLVYVTGGFTTAFSMVRAVQEGSTHGVGLGRAACAEPDLPNLILSGQVSAAKKTLLDTSNFRETANAAEAQIHQIGKGERVLDLSNAEEVDRYKELSKKFDRYVGENRKKGLVVVYALNMEEGCALYD